MVGRVLPFLAYGWISEVVINNRGNKAFVLIQKQSHLLKYILLTKKIDVSIIMAKDVN